MECKVFYRDLRIGTILDLIDTLWNVKAVTMIVLLAAIVDLIDTLWNVKVATINTLRLAFAI